MDRLNPPNTAAVCMYCMFRVIASMLLVIVVGLTASGSYVIISSLLLKILVNDLPDYCIYISIQLKHVIPFDCYMGNQNGSPHKCSTSA